MIDVFVREDGKLRRVASFVGRREAEWFGDVWCGGKALFRERKALSKHLPAMLSTGRGRNVEKVL